MTLRRLTLIVAVKPQCEGCRSFLSGDYGEFSNIDVVIVSAVAADEWSKVTGEVIVAPEFLKELGVTSAPFYVLVDPAARRVLTEGVVFDPAQVREEIAQYLTT